MYSQANTSRLHRMSKVTSSIRRSSNSSFDAKDNFKLAAINSVRRGVKHNDISFITKGDLSMVKQEGGNTVDLATVRTQEGFEKIRKQYDTLQKEKMNLEKLLVKIKEELQHAKEEEQIYSLKKNGASKNVDELESVLDEKRELLEEMSINNKCYLNILNRLKTDKVFFGEKKYNLENTLKEMKKQYSIIFRQGVSKEDEGNRATNLKQNLRKQIEQEQRKRFQQLQLIVSEIEMLRNTSAKQEVRSKQIKQIKERAHQDKSEDEKSWKGLLLTHYFVSLFLKAKMDKEMDKFRIVETAFKNIKLSTGVTNAKSIVEKYLSRETVYGNLLDNIANKQKRIQELRKDRQFLIKQLKDESNNIEISDSKKHKQLEQLKVLDSYAQKKLKTELQRTKFNMWIQRQLRKINKLQTSQLFQTQDYPQQNASKKEAHKFQKYLSWIQNQIQVLNESTTISDTIFQEIEYDEKQIRRVKSESSDEEQNSSLHVEDNYYLNAERNVRLRENDKFMKDLQKRKHQQLRLEIEIAALKKLPSMSPTKKEKELD